MYNNVQCVKLLREAAKKNLLLMAKPLNGQAIKAKPPSSPSSLMAVRMLEHKKKVKKSSFSLMAKPFTPPPPSEWPGQARHGH